MKGLKEVCTLYAWPTAGNERKFECEVMKESLNEGLIEKLLNESSKEVWMSDRNIKAQKDGLNDNR